MLRSRGSKVCDERGSSVVSFLIALPLIITLITAMIDFGRLPLVMGDATRASETAARTVASDPTIDTGALRERVVEAAPSLTALNVAVEIEWGDVKRESYSHHYYDRSLGVFKTRSSTTETRPFTLHVSVGGDWLTPAGELVNDATGAHGFSFKTSSTGTVDTTVEGGVW